MPHDLIITDMESLSEIHADTEGGVEAEPFTGDITIEATFKPPHRPRWRMIRRAHKLMRETPLGRLWKQAAAGGAKFSVAGTTEPDGRHIEIHNVAVME